MEDGQIQCCSESCSKTPESFFGSAAWKRQKSARKRVIKDLVTRWDRRTEQLLRNEILTAFPRDAIVGEEYPPEAHRTGSVTWYIDPIDGTTNFINQHQNYAIFRGVLGWKRTAVRTGAGCGAKDAILGKAWRRAHGRIRHRFHTSVRRELSELLLTTPGLQYTFLEPHPYQERMIRLSPEGTGSPVSRAPWPWNFVRWLLAGQIYSLPCALPPGITTRRRESSWRRPGVRFSQWLEMNCLWSRKSTVLALNAIRLERPRPLCMRICPL